MVGSLVLFLNMNEWYYLAGFVLMLGLTIVRSLTAKDPFIKPSLFKNRKYVSGVIVGFTLFSAVIGIVFLIPLLLNRIHGLDPGQIGLILFPGAMSSVVIGPIAGNLADKHGNPYVVRRALVLILAGLVFMAAFLGVSGLIISGGMLLLYMGFALFQTSMINSVSQTLSNEETGAGMGVFNLATIISGVVGTALVGRILDAKWLDFRLLSAIPMTGGYDYGNLMLLFAFIIASGGILFLRSFRTMRKKPEPESENIGAVLEKDECSAC
jgi:DHA2 family metal-tetracycline-proton antiporter-like MFS transporter